MRPKTLLVLFLLVAGMAGFLWFVDRDLPGTDQRAERAKRLLDLEGEVTRMVIERGEERLVFERSEAGEWRLAQPVDARADSSLLDGFVAELSELEKERTFDDARAGELGLVPPRASVTLAAGADEASFLVGSDVPASDAMIVAADTDGPYHVVSSAIWPGLERPIDDWRVRAVFPRRRDDIAEVTLLAGDRRVSLVSRDGDYHLAHPIEDRADEGTVSRFLDALVDLQAEVFVDGVAAGDNLGLESSDRGVEVVFRDSPEPWRLDLGGAVSEVEAESEEEDAGQIYARADDQVYVVADALTEAIERPAAEWRSLDWTGRQVHEIERLAIDDAKGTLTLERDGGEWLRDGVTTEYGPVSDLLYDIVGVKAEALDAGDAVGGEPELRLTVNPGANALVLEVFPSRGDRYPATASDRSTALWLGGDRVRALEAKIEAVRAAETTSEADAGAGSPAAAEGSAESK